MQELSNRQQDTQTMQVENNEEQEQHYVIEEDVSEDEEVKQSLQD